MSEIKTFRPEKMVARLVMQVPGHKLRHETKDYKEVLFTVRPADSKLGAGEYSLPGGKLEQIDFETAKSPIEVNLSLETAKAVALMAVVREILEETGVSLAPELLQFVAAEPNGDWTSFVFALELTEKPTIAVNPDSAGAIWLESQRLLDGEVSVFADHLALTQAGLRQLAA